MFLNYRKFNFFLFRLKKNVLIEDFFRFPSYPICNEWNAELKLLGFQEFLANEAELKKLVNSVSSRMFENGEDFEMSSSIRKTDYVYINGLKNLYAYTQGRPACLGPSISLRKFRSMKEETRNAKIKHKRIILEDATEKYLKQNEERKELENKILSYKQKVEEEWNKYESSGTIFARQPRNDEEWEEYMNAMDHLSFIHKEIDELQSLRERVNEGSFPKRKKFEIRKKKSVFF